MDLSYNTCASQPETTDENICYSPRSLTEQSYVEELKPNTKPSYRRRSGSSSEESEGEDKVSKLNKKMQRYERELEILRRKLRGSDEKVERDVASAVNREREAKKETERLKAECEQLEKFTTEANELNEEFGITKTGIQDLKKTNKDLQKRKSKIAKQHDQWCDRVTAIHEKANQSGNTYRDLVPEFADIKQKNDYLRDRNEEMRVANEALTENLKLIHENYNTVGNARLTVANVLNEIIEMTQDGLEDVDFSNEITQIGLDCQSRSIALLEKVKASVAA